MTSEEKRPTLIRFVMATYQKLLKAAGGETGIRGQQVTVPKLTEEIMEVMAANYTKLLKIAADKSVETGTLITVPHLIEEIVTDAIRKHGKTK